MEKWIMITASAIFATQNNKLNPCAPRSFKSEVLWHRPEAEGGGRRRDRSHLNQYLFWICLVLRVLFLSTYL